MFVRTESFKQFLTLYPVVSIIICIQLIIFILSLPFPSIMKALAGVNVLITHGEYWRIVTPIFVHADFPHLLFNSFSLVLFAPALERALGKTSFILVYLACGIGANLGTYFVHSPFYMHVGASGSIFGLFGVYLAVILFKREYMPSHGMQVIIPIAVLSVIMTFFTPNVNIAGHIFGIILGLLIGRIILHFRPIRFY